MILNASFSAMLKYSNLYYVLQIQGNIKRVQFVLC